MFGYMFKWFQTKENMFLQQTDTNIKTQIKNKYAQLDWTDSYLIQSYDVRMTEFHHYLNFSEYFF